MNIQYILGISSYLTCLFITSIIRSASTALLLLSRLIHVDTHVVEQVLLPAVCALNSRGERTREPLVEPRNAGPSTDHLPSGHVLGGVIHMVYDNDDNDDTYSY